MADSVLRPEGGFVRRRDMRAPGHEAGRSDRPRWTVVPFVSVGSLRFGMSHGEVVAALGATPPVAWRPGSPAEFGDAAVTTYYGDSGRLMCVAVDAFRGPQVVLEDLSPAGCEPTELEDRFTRYAESRRAEVCHSQDGSWGSEELGLVIRTQRAGDLLLTRPVFVAREWAPGVADAQLGFVPQEEWAVR